MLGKGFINKYYDLSREKNSFLCIGLDPTTKEVREKYIIPEPLIKKYGLINGTMKFCKDFINAISPFTPIIKPNAQFIVYNFGYDEIKELVEIIHEGNCLALLDCKLSDIGSTMDAALFWIEKLGFDAITFNPFPGYMNGVDAVYKWSEDKEKGIFALCRMSNPGTHDYQSKIIDDTPFYLKLARDAYSYGANGFVVGATANQELKQIREIIGEERLILSPGLGPQGGDPEIAIKYGSNSLGEGLLVSSSRTVNYAYEVMGWKWERFAEASAFQAKKHRDELNNIKQKIFS
ncbi:orotidine-5'-phosphate decarboxylase [Candidatus Bathyarchaeota archaeon]|nr:orotidine-5'-phosphate decarboxylase [Candidatus Bathyarchaeota archaeon]